MTISRRVGRTGRQRCFVCGNASRNYDPSPSLEKSSPRQYIIPRTTSSIAELGIADREIRGENARFILLPSAINARPRLAYKRSVEAVPRELLEKSRAKKLAVRWIYVVACWRGFPASGADACWLAKLSCAGGSISA